MAAVVIIYQVNVRVRPVLLDPFVMKRVRMENTEPNANRNANVKTMANVIHKAEYVIVRQVSDALKDVYFYK